MKDPIATITTAIEAFGDHNRSGAVELAKELRTAVQKTVAGHIEALEHLKSKARRQNDLAWNAAIDRVEAVLELELITEDYERIRTKLIALKRVVRAAPDGRPA
jgi:hypothetical protein